MYNFDLWKTSGHAAHYKENMFCIDVEKQEFGLKPMNCPGEPHWGWGDQAFQLPEWPGSCPAQ